MPSSVAGAARPNFLLFITDQQRPDQLGCYGNAQAQTPHIDALAGQGSRFDEFHVATPICQPNRASLITGRMPSSHGVGLNGRELSHAETGFVEVLRRAGYATALCGKSHLQNITSVPAFWPEAGQRLEREAKQAFPGAYGQEVASRWQGDPLHELQLPYYGFERASLTIGHADEQWGHWRRWLLAQAPEATQWIGPEHAIPTPDYELSALRQAWRTRLPESLYPTAYVAQQTSQLLEQFAASRQPFFIQCSFADPHHPFTPPGRYWDLAKPEDFEVPSSFHAPLSDPPPPIQYLRQALASGAQRKPGYATFACTERQAQEALALNHGLMACIDDAVGHVMQQLAQLGLDDNTVVVFTSDHGEMMGDRGLMFKGGLHYPALTQVPFLWRDTVEQRQAKRSPALTQTIDIAPTMLARAGFAASHGMQGHSLLPLMLGQQSKVRDALLIEEEGQRRDFGLERRLRMRTLRTERHRLTIYDGQQWGELYDCIEDPMQYRNLWNQPQALNTRQALSEQLAYTMLAHTDSAPYPSASA